MRQHQLRPKERTPLNEGKLGTTLHIYTLSVAYGAYACIQSDTEWKWTDLLPPMNTK